MERYDSAVGKNVALQTNENNFLGRQIVSFGSNALVIKNNANSTATIIIVTSAIALITLGGFFFLRKRKEI